MGERETAGEGLDLGDYCRRVEMHLAQVNRGHLVRVVGPAFELVRTWALRGVPLNVVRRGIDLKVERHARGVSTRALRLEFCEADVEAEFASWKRAVGLVSVAGVVDVDADAVPSASVPASAEATPATASRRSALPRIIDRAIDRLSAAGGRLDRSDAFRAGTSAALDQLAGIRGRLAKTRGQARVELVGELVEVHRALVELAHGTGGSTVADATKDAVAELQVYRARLTPALWQRSVEASRDRLLLDRLGLPWLADVPHEVEP